MRKGLELALSRGDIVIRKPPVKHPLDIPSGEEVEGQGENPVYRITKKYVSLNR